jgi:hypothetical protein
MNAGDLHDAVREFVDALGKSGGEVAADVRKRALELASDAQDLATELYGSTHEKYYNFNAYVGQVSNDIHDAFSENDLYVIMNALLQALTAAMRDALGGPHGNVQ